MLAALLAFGAVAVVIAVIRGDGCVDLAELKLNSLATTCGMEAEKWH
jgi:hypothetical protein